MGEISATDVEDQAGSVSINMNGGIEMWAVEIDIFNDGEGHWIAAGYEPDNFVNGVAAYNNDAFVAGYSTTPVDLFPSDPSWPVSPVINTGINTGARDQFIARIGDLYNSNGVFYKKDPESVTSNNELTEKKSWDVQLMPNPSSGQVRILLEGGGDHEWEYEVYNAAGGLMKSSGNINAGNFDQYLDWGDLSPGLYLVRILQGDNTSTKRLMIK